MLQDIFDIALNRISQNADSLYAIKNYRHSGVEGWLKVELVQAFYDHELYNVCKIFNTGADLGISSSEDGKIKFIELKGMTNFDVERVCRGLNRANADCCLFLVKNKERQFEKLLNKDHIELVNYAYLLQNTDDWLLGMIKKKQ